MIAFILAFVFRAYVVEAFVIPTGSMAPSLAGQHVRVTCTQCGYHFKVDASSRRPRRNADAEGLSCPMCHYANRLPGGGYSSAGDRILVHKYIYSLVEPRRWDVIVFKNPQLVNRMDGSAGPTSNYIKRLVGLPHESLWLIEGNVYVQPNPPNADQPWRIARKTQRPKVQQAVWQPIYHSSYIPLDRGKGTDGRIINGQLRHPWSVPWVTKDAQPWVLNNRHGYRHESAQPGQIHFDFQAALHGGPGLYAYNQPKDLTYPEPIEDIRLAADFMPDQPGLSIRLKTTARLDDLEGQPKQLIGQISAEGVAELLVVDPQTGATASVCEPATVGPFEPHQARSVELWYVDQQASLWVDGQQVGQWSFDLPIDAIQTRRLAAMLPNVTIEVAGSPVTLHRVELDRDLYYSMINPRGPALHATWIKQLNKPPYGRAIHLKGGQYFCLGDNSPASLDSRYWEDVHPWVRKHYFSESDRLRETLGIIPREMVMGRAFFVYFPAMLRANPTGSAFILNFGEMRFIR